MSMGILTAPLGSFSCITESQAIFPANSSFPTFHPRRRLTASASSDAANPTRPIKVNLFQKLLFEMIDNFTRSLKYSSSSSSTLPSCVDPNHGAAGSFSPAAEVPPTSCDVVEGSLPAWLDGVYIQNGPNPQFIPRPPYNIVDGDGMLHSVKISGGEAIFCSRFVRTHKYRVEREFGYNMFPNFFAFAIHQPVPMACIAIAGVITGLFNPLVNGIGPASTSLALINRRLFALIETDLPYEIKISGDGDIITLGRHDFHSTTPFFNMTAHPKIDPHTGEAFAFRYFVFRPFITLFRIDSNGRKQKDVPILSQVDGSYAHDFALTNSFVIFPYTQVVTDPREMLKGRPIVRVDDNKVSGLGFIPRYAENDREMWRIDVPGLNILHVVNAWEEEEEKKNGDKKIVIVVSNMWPIEHAFKRPDLAHLSLEKIVIRAKEKSIVGRVTLSGTSLDFGVINPKYAMKKTRYVYAAVIEDMPKMIGLVKLDLSRFEAGDSGDCTVARRLYGDGCYGSEPVFVPRSMEDPVAEEDDGYLLTFVTSEKTEESHLLVMDAKSKDLQVVAAVKLPQRVPQGFHTIFVREGDLG